ncbi:hypothetical protein [Nocardioides sp. SLBN-35]|uniref:hypothetical protein n=1 Tax=Nocardioides sp. SLBN-35 TaxID=2768445 RepID=UPI0011525F47|nr:hypothetical protein [Nocardioides sp. SLBN-35]TQK71273.1 hypothetical protein FBY23_3062 [Nocardioides sp. SLBN-35]
MTTVVRFTDIVDWYEGRLDPAAADEVQRAIDAGDERTWSAVRWLQRFNAASASLQLSAPPPIVRQNLRQAFRDWAAIRPVDSSAPRSVVAALIFDSRQGPTRTGTRSGAGDDGTVHLAFGSDDVDVMLDVTPLGEHRVRIEGQVLPVDADTSPVFRASVVAGGETFRTVEGDRLGRFAFDSVPDDVCEVVAENRDLRVSVRLEHLP